MRAWTWFACVAVFCAGAAACQEQAAPTPASTVEQPQSAPGSAAGSGPASAPGSGPGSAPGSAPGSNPASNPHGDANPHGGANPHGDANPHGGNPHAPSAEAGSQGANPHGAPAWKPVTFTEPGEGPRAPTSGALMVKVGFSTLDEVKALLAEKKITCDDQSPMAMIEKIIAKYMTEAKEKQARGETVDMAKYEQYAAMYRQSTNPQVRMSCEELPSSALTDRARPEAKGRWLFVFDDAKAPLRLVSYQRMHTDPKLALSDFEGSVQSFGKLFGKETKSMGDIPDAKAPEFKKLIPVKREWAFSDVQAKVVAINMGSRGVDVSEVVEVPWPVRPNAPADPKK